MRFILVSGLVLGGAFAWAQANTSLSNLDPTSVNADVVPDDLNNQRKLGAFGRYWYVLYAQGVIYMNGLTGSQTGTVSYVNNDMPSGSESGILGVRGLGGDGSVSSSVAVYSASVGQNTGKIYLETGNTGGGDSGDIAMRTGTASGKRGSVLMDALSLRVPVASADPVAAEGSIYYNTLIHKLRIFNGSVWENIN